jgi:hypothetical protein
MEKDKKTETHAEIQIACINIGYFVSLERGKYSRILLFVDIQDQHSATTSILSTYIITLIKLGTKSEATVGVDIIIVAFTSVSLRIERHFRLNSEQTAQNFDPEPSNFLLRKSVEISLT